LRGAGAISKFGALWKYLLNNGLSTQNPEIGEAFVESWIEEGHNAG
jgi:hypothetical protein